MEDKPASNPVLTAEPPDSAALSPRPIRWRLDSIDYLRGIVMVLMALDHTRDYLGGGTGLPRDVHEPTLFLTRWITNVCAPTFVFLAGMGAFLYGCRASGRAALSRFLLTRGLWLVLCELTLVRFGWSFSIRPDFILLQVIWAIGWSMVLLAGFVFLPRTLLGTLALGIIAGHNLLDGVTGESWGPFQVGWTLLHRPGLFELAPAMKVLAVYPLIPWFGVMLLGYVFGPVMLLEPPRRRRTLLACGTGLAVLFVVLRALNCYGDPGRWSVQNSFVATALSFANCEKYPPSLLFAVMTLGPALLILGLLNTECGTRSWESGVLAQARRVCARFFVSFGRVPFFYFLAHIYFIHLVTVVVALVQGGPTAWLAGGLPPMAKPPGWGFGLAAVYVFWIGIVLLLYPLCRWFGRVKQSGKFWWMSYL